MRSLLPHTLALLACTAASPAADLLASGDWTQRLNAAHLVSGAGSNLPTQIQSLAGVTTLSISNAPGTWTVRVRRVGGPWHSDVSLFARRTSAGAGSGAIAGGDAFVEVTGSESELFSGSGARSNIALQFKLTGLSAGITPANYLSSIIFTVQ
jgi:hypothetical protein